MIRRGWTTVQIVACCITGSACDEAPTWAEEYGSRPNLILFTSLYSAFGGEHAYSVTPYVPTDADAEPLDLTTSRWVVDPEYLESEPFSSIDGAIKLTTKRVGSTQILLFIRTRSGQALRVESKLTISAADDETWRKGDERYAHGPDRPRGHGPLTNTEQAKPGPCGLSPDTIAMLPDNGACTSCHNAAGTPLATVPTPTQIAGYSDEQLLAIFSRGEKPEGYTFTSPFLREQAQPDCVYPSFHSWAFNDVTERGLLLKLRSLPPEAHPEQDLVKIQQQRRAHHE